MKDFKEKGMKYSFEFRVPLFRLSEKDKDEMSRIVKFTGKIDDNDFTTK